MAGQNRTVAVLFALLAAMTVGAMVLMTLDQYARCGGIQFVQLPASGPCRAGGQNTLQTAPAQWDGIEVFYSRTRAAM